MCSLPMYPVDAAEQSSLIVTDCAGGVRQVAATPPCQTTSTHKLICFIVSYVFDLLNIRSIQKIQQQKTIAISCLRYENSLTIVGCLNWPKATMFQGFYYNKVLLFSDLLDLYILTSVTLLFFSALDVCQKMSHNVLVNSSI